MGNTVVTFWVYDLQCVIGDLCFCGSADFFMTHNFDHPKTKDIGFSHAFIDEKEGILAIFVIPVNVSVVCFEPFAKTILNDSLFSLILYF